MSARRAEFLPDGVEELLPEAAWLAEENEANAAPEVPAAAAPAAEDAAMADAGEVAE